jgi:hypothetical protein
MPKTATTGPHAHLDVSSRPAWSSPPRLPDQRPHDRSNWILPMTALNQIQTVPPP